MNMIKKSFDELAYLDLNYFPMLAVLLNEKHVSNAATTLEISQPAMSQLLKKFRKIFSDPLLVKTQRGMILTNKAQEINQTLAPILALMINTIECRQFCALTTQGTVRLIMDDVCARVCIVKIITHLQLLAPKLNLQISALGDDSFQQLRRGQVDFVISVHNGSFHDLNHNIISSIAFQDASMPHFSHDKELKRLVYKHLGCDKSSVTTDKSLDEMTALKSDSLGTVVNALKTSNTLAWLPRYVTKARDNVNTALQWKGQIEQHPLKLFWNDDSEHSEVNKWLRNELTLLLPKILQD
ncbi:LysR family transcriptional regulator [Shewanella sp. YLB-07]|uniref:LysR family transcriptional regulator n=1 Tax=Shewanella sp. YLB-07 TaxID=2601268 RepID=UPI00128CC0EE|nr:LysR family transcriptional regulator [Shewanella sp. YLB-07]MPY26895.1 LysR family transcriptional regulator [Shewanella sp. YLB-07]